VNEEAAVTQFNDQEPLISIRVETRDRRPVLTVAAFVVLWGATALAVFGIPTIDVHGPLHAAGIMDPLCGATRSVRLAAIGNLNRAIEYNPVGPTIIMVSLLVVVRAVAGRVSGKWVSISVHDRRPFYWLAAALLLWLEIRQQQRAELLSRPW